MREKIRPDEAEAEGGGGSTFEADNEAWRIFAATLRDGAIFLISSSLVAKIHPVAEILRALQLGARGVLIKSGTGQALFQCIYRVMAGEYCIEQLGVNSLEAVRDGAMGKSAPPNRYGSGRGRLFERRDRTEIRP